MKTKTTQTRPPLETLACVNERCELHKQAGQDNLSIRKVYGRDQIRYLLSNRLEHVHLTRDAVCIFDCIEFNDRFRYQDVAADLAFLAMDLDYHGRPDLARYFSRRMARTLDDPDLLNLLDFYKTYRAHVRAKVAAFRADEEEASEEEQAASRSSARRHFALALQYAIVGSEPHVLVVMGRVGTGKSTQARLLGEALDWPVASSDRTRKNLAGVPLYRRGSVEERDRLYSSTLTEATYRALRDRALTETDRGRGIVLDATYSNQDERTALSETLRDAGLKVTWIECTAPDALIKERLRERSSTPTVSDARLEDFDTLDERYTTPDADASDALLRVSTEVSPEETSRRILLSLVKRHLNADTLTPHVEP